MAMFHSELELQLSEVEMLQSMFPAEDEMCLDHPTSVVDIQRYIDGKREALPKQLASSLRVNMENEQVKYRCCHSHPFLPIFTAYKVYPPS